MYEVVYYKRLSNKWLKGRVRNLTFSQALTWLGILSELFDTRLIKMRKVN